MANDIDSSRFSSVSLLASARICAAIFVPVLTLLTLLALAILGIGLIGAYRRLLSPQDQLWHTWCQALDEGLCLSLFPTTRLGIEATIWESYA
jgi:hypothetical protein